MSDNLTQTQQDIVKECDAIREMLLEKNRAYGDSALNPVRIFSKAPPDAQLEVRLDDKLSRLSRGSAAGEDVTLDLIGYLILLRIARGRVKAEPAVEVATGKSVFGLLQCEDCILTSTLEPTVSFRCSLNGIFCNDCAQKRIMVMGVL